MDFAHCVPIILVTIANCVGFYERDEWSMAAILENEKLDQERDQIRKRAHEYPGSGPLGSSDPYGGRGSYFRDLLTHLVSQMMTTMVSLIRSHLQLPRQHRFTLF